jgi:myo-inositol 2-dehydrogenase / D-chiro-inositol 1-dehydrogenase
MRAAVMGTGWGRVHVHALRRSGAQIVAVCGAPQDASRTRAFAVEEHIPLALDDPRSVLDLGVHVVSVATPAHTHQDMLTLFQDLPVICEKPVLGVAGDLAGLPKGGAVSYINYAFSFLDSAQVFTRALQRLGPPSRVSVETAYDLALSFTGPEWFLEVASHPLSFVVHLLGEPALLTGSTIADPYDVTRLDLAIAEVEVEVVSRHQPGLHGLRHTIRARTSGGVLELTGTFHNRQPWRFEPVRLDGVPLNEGEWSPDDCWRRANDRSIAAALAAIRADMAPEQAGSAGLFTQSRAAVIDRCLQQAFS